MEIQTPLDLMKPVNGQNNGIENTLNQFNDEWSEYAVEKCLYQYQRRSILMLKHKTSGKSVVAKVMKLSKQSNETNEVKIMSKLNHKNIIQFYGHNIDINESTTYMEYVEGHTLTERINIKGVFDLELGFNIYCQLLEALEYLKSMKVAHLDLKPDNIMINENNNIKIIDFEASFDYSQNIYCKKLVGSYPYLAPEALKSIPYRVDKFDIFSLHIVLVNILTGSMLWDWPDMCDNIYNSWIESKYPHNAFKFISYDTFNFLKDVMIEDVDKRPDIDQIKLHSYYQINWQRCFSSNLK